MIRIAIAEDDPQCFAQLERYVSDYGKETGRAFHITHYDNGEDSGRFTAIPSFIICSSYHEGGDLKR